MPLRLTPPTVPSAPQAVEKTAARHLGIAPPRLAPALQRRLHGVHAIKSLRPRLAATTGALFVAAIAGIAIPAAAQPVAPVVAAVEAPAQSLSIAAAAATPIEPVARDAYTAISAPKPAAKAAAVAAVAGLQYPVPLGSAVVSGYGPRDCAGCYSNFHHGADIFPGAGTPVSAMASGTVSAASATSSGAYGVSVTLKHTIDGQLVTSVYAHLQAGSMNLSVGDTVSVGQVIGLVGATGNAQGAHLHFEIHPGGGDSVDPYAWLAARIG